MKDSLDTIIIEQQAKHWLAIPDNKDIVKAKGIIREVPLLCAELRATQTAREAYAHLANDIRRLCEQAVGHSISVAQGEGLYAVVERALSDLKAEAQAALERC